MRVPTLKPRLAAIDTRTARALPVVIEGATPRQRGDSWQHRRAALFQREPLCRCCAELGIVELATIADHVMPLWNGGPDVDSNLQPLCVPCHARKTAREARERAKLKSQ